MMCRTILGAATIALLIAAGPHKAFAEGELVYADDPYRLFQILRGFGSAELDTDQDGDPLITGRMEGVQYQVLFYGCTDNRDCRAVQFRAAWSMPDVTLQALNEWNRTKRFGKAYIDHEGDPVIEMSINLDFGVSEDNFVDTVDWWRIAVTDFRDLLEDMQS